MTDADLDEWQQLADAATAGPWDSNSFDGDPIESVWTVSHAIATANIDAPKFDFHAPQARHDAAFIAVARTAVPQLIAEVRRLRAIVNGTAVGNGTGAPLGENT